jgi:hypothetical protein
LVLYAYLCVCLRILASSRIPRYDLGRQNPSFLRWFCHKNVWLMDCSCLRHMTGNKKLFSSLTPLSHKGYVTFGDDNKDKVLSTGVIKVSDHFTLNDVALVDKLRYNLFSVSQLVDADLDVPFHKSDSHVLDSSGKRVCDISRIGKVFQDDFSYAQSSVKCLIS